MRSSEWGRSERGRARWSGSSTTPASATTTGPMHGSCLAKGAAHATGFAAYSATSGDLSRRNVLIPSQHVPRVEARLQCLQPVERIGAERVAHALDRLVRLHVVGVAAADRPGF